MQMRLQVRLLTQDIFRSRMSGAPNHTPDAEGEGTQIPNGRQAPRPRPPPKRQKDSGDGQTDTAQPDAKTPDLVLPVPPSNE